MVLKTFRVRYGKSDVHGSKLQQLPKLKREAGGKETVINHTEVNRRLRYRSRPTSARIIMASKGNKSLINNVSLYMYTHCVVALEYYVNGHYFTAWPTAIHACR